MSSAPGVAVGSLNSPKIGDVPAAVTMAAFMFFSPLWPIQTIGEQYLTPLDII
jgi:hypothetical protein